MEVGFEKEGRAVLGVLQTEFQQTRVEISVVFELDALFLELEDLFDEVEVAAMDC